MGYSIAYSPKNNKKYPIRNKQPNIIKIVYTSIVIALLIAGLIRLDKNGAIKEILLPGDIACTERALETFVENIRGGEPFPYAVTSFCLEIIENAQHAT